MLHIQCLFLVPYWVLLYSQLGCVTVSHMSVLPLFHDTDLCIIQLFRNSFNLHFTLSYSTTLIFVLLYIIQLFRNSFNLHFTLSSPNPAMLISALYSSAGLQLCRITALQDYIDVMWLSSLYSVHPSERALSHGIFSCWFWFGWLQKNTEVVRLVWWPEAMCLYRFWGTSELVDNVFVWYVC